MRYTPIILALTLMSAGAAFAQPGSHGHGQPACGQPGQPACTEQGNRDQHGNQANQGNQGQQGNQGGHGQDQAGPPPDGRRWSRGDRLPEQYRQSQNMVSDWRSHNLAPPPRGYRWACDNRGNCFLVRTTTGVIRDTRWRDDRDAYWRQSYSRTYSYNDDVYYRECRNRPDPAGILIGGIIGGLIGRAAGNESAGATVAGIIIGGVAGAALTSNMDCNDRNYAYRAYYDGLNSNRAGIVRRWRNPSNNHRGDFMVRNYYFDQRGFQCANYRHTAYLDRRRQADGRACRQPDGAWAFLN